ncbi:MAG: hypothetical protein AB8H80_12590 [Planctomycetota bacterium]
MNYASFLSLSLLACPLAAQIVPGDIAVTGFSTSEFAVINAGTATTITTPGFGGATSQSILFDPFNPLDVLVGGFGFVGRATVAGPGVVLYTPLTTAVGTAAQMSWLSSTEIVIADAGTDQVRLLTTSGTLTDLSSGTQPWGTSINAGACDPATASVVVGGNGSLHRLLIGAPVATTIATGLGGFVSNVSFDPCNGDVLATVLGVNRLVRVDAAGTVTDEIAPGIVTAPNSFDIDENGSYLIGAAGGNVFLVPPGGTTATPVGSFSGLGSSTSGLAYVGANSCSYGAGCAGPTGVPNLELSGAVYAGSPLTTVSDNHTPGAIGVAVFGLSAAAPPVALDPILGTSGGCELLVSADLLDAGLTDAAGNFVHVIQTVPAFANLRLYVQHAVIEGAGLSSFSLSQARTIRF